MNGSFSSTGFIQLDFIEEGRKDIFEWRQKRRTKRSGLQGRIYEFTKLFIDKSLIESFVNNLSIVVAFQMLLAAICTYACVRLGLEFDVHMSLFVSPIVFPLAFSINANYQRRETVLEDLAMFKAASLILFFCHRDWIKAVGLPADLVRTLSEKLASLVINIKEYLYTDDSDKRKVILQAIYEDFSDVSQLNDKLRQSQLKNNSSLIARLIHCHNLMCWSFEKLRVIKEYKSPRSLRSFTKVFIFLMPLLLSPYYVFTSRSTGSEWAAYVIAVLVSFLFGSLQAVQDKLDDPFDGIGEDDVHLGQLDEWTRQSLVTNRTVTVGRFTVTTTTAAKDDNAGGGNTSPGLQIRIVNNQHEDVLSLVGSPQRKRRSLKRKPTRKPEGRHATCVGLGDKEFTDRLESRCHGIASKLEGISGSTTIGRRSAKPCNSQHVKLSDVQASIFHRAGWMVEDSKSGTEFSEEGFTDSGSEKEDNMQDLYPRRNGLDIVKESDEEYVHDPRRPSLSSPAVTSLQSMFTNHTDELKTDENGENENVAETNGGVAMTHDETEGSRLLGKRDAPFRTPSPSDPESGASLLSPPVSSDLDSSQENIAGHHRHNKFTVSEPEHDRDNVPRVKFTFGGKKKQWSMPESLGKWRKRRTKKKPSSLETIDQLGSEPGLNVETSDSPLLANEKASTTEQKGASLGNLSMENNGGLESNEGNSQDSKKPSPKLNTPKQSPSRFSVLRRSSEILKSDQGSLKNNESRFNVVHHDGNVNGSSFSEK